MLTSLTVRNFTIVEQLDLEFGAGMTVITGETGAGKSILLDALGLALGDRGQSELVRATAERLEVHATFAIGALAGVQSWLTERDLHEGDECVLARSIHREGRSRAFINGRPVTIADLRKLGEQLLDIHGQHDHQSLMHRDSHLHLLDEFGALGKRTSAVAEAHRLWHALSHRIHALKEQDGEARARLDLLSYQIEELDRLAPTAGEVEQLDTEFRSLSNAGTALQSGQEALQWISEEEGSAIQALQQAQKRLLELDDPHPRLQGAKECLSAALVQSEEALTDLRAYVDSRELNPERIAEVEARLDALHSMARKHRIRSEELPEFYADLVQQLADIQRDSSSLEELEQELEQLKETYFGKAQALSKARKTAAGKLDRLIVERVKQLGLPGARFETRLSPGDPETPRASGLESAEFFVSMNPGQPLRPLAKVASGGELSRIGLAICVATAERAQHATLIFDEVDTGIGGAVAEMVGRQLRELGKHGQCICVTHLPQVAALAHHHLFVSKSSSKSSTTTEISALTADAKVSEIARMLGGLKISDESVAHAREMIDCAEEQTA